MRNLASKAAVNAQFDERRLQRQTPRPKQKKRKKKLDRVVSTGEHFFFRARR